jgi:glucose/arabinose dehydrogenase
MSRIVHLAAVIGLLSWAAGCGNSDRAAQLSPPPAAPSLTFTMVAAGIDNPTAIGHAGDGSGRLFLAEQAGSVRIVHSDGTLQVTPFLDISDRLVSGGERGLLGLAFPPGYARKGYFYVNYTRHPDGATVVSRFRVAVDPDLAEAASEEIILTVSQPFGNHNGGHLAFGPDGLLYIGLGDGGSGGDPLGHGQNPESLLGSLLRLDVESGVVPYGIPADNPFVADPGARDEIWALGLRNPWRFSFDRLTGDIYVADVGQARWEEINFQAGTAGGGANYGWNIFEGPECFPAESGCVEPPAYSAPVAFYGHDLGCSVTGGYVYRGPGNPGLQGLYLYGDFCSGRLWGLRSGETGWRSEVLALTDFTISVFGEDEAGRLHVADYATGTIHRIDEE